MFHKQKLAFVGLACALLFTGCLRAEVEPGQARGTNVEASAEIGESLEMPKTRGQIWLAENFLQWQWFWHGKAQVPDYVVEEAFGEDFLSTKFEFAAQILVHFWNQAMLFDFARAAVALVAAGFCLRWGFCLFAGFNGEEKKAAV